MGSFGGQGVPSPLLKALPYNLQGAGHAQKDKPEETNLQEGKTSNQAERVKKYKTGR